MFYAHFVLSKKGPLARIWLAAHWDKKLTRAHVFETNITSSVEAILEPKLKMALRTSGHLLLGVVRIYSRKAKYLLADCNEIYVKIKTAFRPGVVDLPDEANREAAIAAITLPENIQDYEATMADLTAININTMSINQSRPEDITMREDFGEINLGRQDDDFGDSAFEDLPSREIIREGDAGYDSVYGRGADASGRLSIRGSDRLSVHANINSNDTLIGDSHHGVDKLDKHLHGLTPARGSHADNMDLDDSFGRGLYDADSDGSFGGEIDHTLFASPNLFEDPSAQKQLDHIASGFENHSENLTLMDTDLNAVVKNSNNNNIDNPVDDLPMTSMAAEVLALHDQKHVPLLSDLNMSESRDVIAPLASSASIIRANFSKDNTTLLSNDSEAFALLPIDVTATSTEPRRAQKRKRRLIIDEQKSIPSELMKIQMQDTIDITTQLDLAPPTKRLMHMKETGGLDKLFTLPGRAIPSRILQRIFTRNLQTHSVPNDLKYDNHLSSIFGNFVQKSSNITQYNESGTSYTMLPIREVLQTSTIFQSSNVLPHHDNQGLGVIHEENSPNDQSKFFLTKNIISTQTLSIHGNGSKAENAVNAAIGIDEIHDPFLAPVRCVSSRPAEILEPQSTLSDDIDDVETDFPLIDTPYMAPPSVLSEAPAEIVGLESELPISDNRADNTTGVFGDDLMGDEHLPEDIEVEEEQRLEKRSKCMLRRLRYHTSQHGWGDSGISLLSMCEGNSKKIAASKFYTILLLRKQGSVELSQSTPFSDILISRGPSFISSNEIQQTIME